jgi:hypothetical protein
MLKPYWNNEDKRWEIIEKYFENNRMNARIIGGWPENWNRFDAQDWCDRQNRIDEPFCYDGNVI